VIRIKLWILQISERIAKVSNFGHNSPSDRVVVLNRGYTYPFEVLRAKIIWDTRPENSNPIFLNIHRNSL